MNLIGKRIKSNKYGYGTVTAFGDDKITISFEDGEKTFIIMLGFESGSLSFEEEEDQKQIMDLIAKQKSSAVSHDETRADVVNQSSASTIENKEPFNVGLSENDEKIQNLIECILNERSIALKLIDKFGDKEFEKHLFTKAFTAMRKAVTSNYIYSKEERMLVIVAMTYLALKYYYDGNLESFIYEKYLEYINPIYDTPTKEVVISRSFYPAIKPKNSSDDYRKVTRYKDKTFYVAVPLVLSVVPHYRVKDLFYFAKDIYKKKLLFSEDISESDMRDKISETLNDLKNKNLINNKYDDKKIGDYCLCMYTKCCIQTGKCIDDLIEIIAKCIRLIINYLTLPEDAYSVPEFFREGFDQWIPKFVEKEQFEQNVILSRPIFYFDGLNIHIKTGRITVDEKYNPNNITLTVFAGDKEIKTQKLNGVNDVEYEYKNDIVGGYIVNRIDILLNHSPLDNISYHIYADGDLIYSSKKLLYRENLFIDEKGYEIKPGYKYIGELKAFTKTKQDEEANDLHKLYHRDGYYIYSAVVDDQSTYSFDDNAYIFYRITNPEILGYTIPWALIECDGKKYPIYKEHSFVFRSSAQIEELMYTLDGIQYSCADNNDLHEISIFAKEHHEYNTYIIKLKFLSAGLHNLKIYDLRRNEKIQNGSFSFVSESSFKRFVNKVESGNIYTYRSELFNEDIVLLYEYGCSKKTLDIFVPNLGHSKLVLFPSSFTYSIDGKEWFDRDKKLCLCSIPPSNNKVYLCGPDDSKAFYFDENHEKQYVALNSVADDEYKFWFSLSQFRTLALSGITAKKLFFEVGKKTKYILIWLVPFVDEEKSIIEIDNVNNVFTFQPFFDGYANVSAKVVDADNLDKIYANQIVKSGDIINLPIDQIDEDTSRLSFSLYLIDESSIVSKPLDKPFFTFEKFQIPLKKFVLLDDKSQQLAWFNEEHTKLFAKFNFTGPNKVRFVLVPTGKFFDGAVLQEKMISSGELIEIDIKKMIYTSYFIKLHQKGALESKPLFVLRIDNDSNIYLHKTFNIFKWIKPVGTYFPKNYVLKTKDIQKIDTALGPTFLLSAEAFTYGVRDNCEYLLDVEDVDETYITFRVCGEVPDHGKGTPKTSTGKIKYVVKR